MAVETNTKIDAGTLTVPAIYANRMQITGHGPIVRLSFGEGMGGTDFHYRAAIAMTIIASRPRACATSPPSFFQRGLGFMNTQRPRTRGRRPTARPTLRSSARGPAHGSP